MSRTSLLPTWMLLLVLASAIISRSNAPSIFGSSQQDASGAIAAAEASGQGAFVEIQAANRTGGNVTSLVNRFNEALEMLDRAKAYMGAGLYDQAIAAAEGVQQLFDAIGHEAIVVQELGAAEISNRKMVIIIAAPIAVILITLLSYFLIRYWRRRGIERTMEMEVREVEAQ